MVTECPKCQTTLTFEFQNLETGSETDCKHCDVRLKIKIVPEIIFDPSLPIEVPKDSKGTILLCIDGEATREVMKALLETLHYFVIDIPSGTSALTNMKHNPPALAFVDSGLSDMSGAALCQEIKGSPNLSQTIVILIGSMFEKNAKYRQEAPDWAGADDYIDRHEIQKKLLTKVEHHLSEKEEIKKEVLEPADQETCKPSLDTVPESEKANVVSESSGVSAEPELDESSYLVKGARRLAKIIVSDIVIYNESKVEEGLKKDNFYELLESEILEGRQLYESRVDKSLYHAGIYEKALETFIEKRTSENIQDIPESEKPTEIFERPTTPTQETKPEVEEREEAVSEEVKGETEPEPESAPSPPSETVEEHKILEENPISLEQARALSKTILSKMMETYSEKAQEGLKNGNLNEMLSNELMIARQEFEEKAPAYFDSSIFEDALEAYVVSKAKVRVEDEAWQASNTPEIGSSQDVFQEMENQAQEIAQEPEPALEDNASESPETLENEAPQDVFQKIENQAQEIAQEPEPALEDSAWESPETLENEAPQDVFQEMENQAQEIAQEPEPALEDNAWESPETLENEAPQDVLQEMENQAQEVAQEPEPESALEHNAWESPETLENETPQDDVFQEMEDQAQEIAQKPEPESALEDSAWESPETLENEAPQDVFQEMENQTEEIAEEEQETFAAPPVEESTENTDSEETKNAKRLARIIVSDIVIYNEKKVEKGLKNGTFYELLEDDIREGRVLFESRVSQTLFEAGLYENALEDFISSRNGTQNKDTLDSQKATAVFQKVEKVEPNPENSESVEESKEEKDAKRLANIIVSDIMIYNEKKVEKGLQNGTFYELLEDDIREGRALYESRVTPKILEEKDYLKEAFADFVSKRTASLS